MHMSTEQDVCANCEKPYGEHLLHDGNKCSLGSIMGWFPKKLADALAALPKEVADTSTVTTEARE